MEGISKFRELLLTDEEFQQKLQAAGEAYDGDQNEEAVFNNVLVPLAAQYGITATFDEFKTYMEDFSSAEMSVEEMEQVAGGIAKFNGGGLGGEACKAIGIGAGAVGTTAGGGACAFVGLGWNFNICISVGRSIE